MLEEADNRLECHIMDQIITGHDTVTVRTVDSDVVAILLGFTIQFLAINPNMNLLVDFGTGNKRKHYSINRAYSDLGKEVADAVMMFHTFSGCDSCSAFFRQTKSTMFKSWVTFEKLEELTEAFRELSCCPSKALLEQYMPLLESYISHTYGSKQTSDLDSLRFDMFRHSISDDLRELPRNRDALHEHAKRAAFQAGWLWGNVLQQSTCPPVDEWGWVIKDEKLFIRWKTLDCGQELSKTLSIYSCRTLKCVSCSCVSNNFKRLIYCKCQNKCRNIVLFSA